MTTFYLIRHGKTELNASFRFQGGGIDSPLLDEGIEQAIQAGKALADTAFDAVAVSTQKRAMDTANYLLMENQHLDGLTVTYQDGLRELGFGEREGVEVDRTDQETDYLRHRPDLYNPTAFGGETFDHMVDRAETVFEELGQNYPEGNVLIVAHGVLLLTLSNYLTGKEKKDWRQGGPLENTSLTILKQKGTGYVMDTFNDISYRKNWY